MSNSFIEHFIFKKIILKYPRTVLLCILAAVIITAYGAKYFKLDASSETLVLESDKDLRYSRLISARYKESDFLMLTFRPKDDLFSEKVLTTLSQIRNDLKHISKIESVMTILDVPLLQSPPVPLDEMASVTRTLESPDVDKTLARKEFAESPLYQNLMVSSDLKTTAIILSFASNPEYNVIFQRRNDLLEKKSTNSGLTEPEQKELKIVKQQCVKFHDQARQNRHNSLLTIRAVMDKYRGDNSLFLGGVSMISDDMISFIKSDLRIFGTAVFLLLVIMIAVIFRRFYWVLLPMLTCIISVTCTIGLLGWAGWEVTVISSNFISLQLIITLAMTIHLMVRYREFAESRPDASQSELILATTREMLSPCVYSGLTTMAGFASLIFSNIKPVISFGYIMVAGVAISIIIPFLFLPAMLALNPREIPFPRKKSRWNLTPALGRFTEAYGLWIVVVSIILLTINVFGIKRIDVENCFINYFKPDTEIYQGMKVVDQQLGGTTPLDIIIDIGQTQQSELKPVEEPADSEDIFEQFETQSQENKSKYWFTPEKIARIAAVHDYLDSLPETGKVLSVVTLVRMIEHANGDKPLDSVELALLFNQIPEKLKQILVNPYVSVENNEFRINTRILDSEPSLKRDILLKKIRADLAGKFSFGPEQVHLTGLLVLYNNMLQNLYSSQIVTMGFAILCLMGAFLVLFRSIRIAAIAIFPNILAVSCVLGVMGWLNIPLDMMTITIAAIGVGLADDDTIHYIHRFKHEVETTGSYTEALHRSHDSIGHAIYYTTVTLVIGFSILSLSNFIPTIYFGLFTVLAITVALLASLTLLPQLLVTFKPYGRNPKPQENRKSKSGG